MAIKDVGPDPTDDSHVVTRGYADGRYAAKTAVDPKGITLTQAQYDALGSGRPADQTYYII